MKIDKDYIKKLLEVFESSNELNISIADLKKIDSDISTESDKGKKFIFHIRLLEDMKLIELDDERYTSKPPTGTVSIKFRLTASGYDYLEGVAKSK